MQDGVWRNCQQCAAPFFSTPNQDSRHGPRRFCSLSCSGKGREHWQKRLESQRICETCGQSFKVVPWMDKATTGPRRFCSMPCMYKGRRPRSWKHRRTHSAGYIQIWLPGHPRASDGYVFEHILVAEANLGRALEPDERVHHKNRDRADNRPQNLQVLTNSEHTKLHAAENAARKRTT